MATPDDGEKVRTKYEGGVIMTPEQASEIREKLETYDRIQSGIERVIEQKDKMGGIRFIILDTKDRAIRYRTDASEPVDTFQFSNDEHGYLFFEAMSALKSGLHKLLACARTEQEFS